MIVLSDIQLYNLLREKVGDEQAQVLTEYIEAKVEKQFEVKKEVLATKDDLRRLEVQLAETKTYIITWLVATIIACTGLAVAIIKLF